MRARPIVLLSALLTLSSCAERTSGAPTPGADAAAPTADTGVPGADAGSDAGPPPPAWGPCDPAELPPGYTVPDDVECAWLDVPLDRADPGAGTVLLRVAVHRAIAPSGLAVFQLAGGPGGSSVAQAGIIPLVLPRLRQRFDLVYVDQRGTGGSGYLDCPGGYPETDEEWQRCARAIASPERAHDLTTDAADDLEDVRAWLGYDRILVRGGSYGTRLGLEYARRHGEHVTAMVLDGTVPPDADFFGYTIGKDDRGVEQLFTDCAADAACSAMAPELRAEAEALVATAETTPRSITVGGGPALEDATLVRQELGAFVEDSYYRFRLPRAIHEAAGDNWARWDVLASDLFGAAVHHVTRGDGALGRALLSQGSYVAPGLYLTVVCAEDLPNAPSLDALRRLASMQHWGETSLVGIANACATLGVPAVDASLRAPVRSDVPTLLMSGAIDIATPPEWGAHAAETLTHARHVIVPDATHATMVTPCGSKIIEDFLLSEGDLDTLDVSCIDAVEVPFDT